MTISPLLFISLMFLSGGGSLLPAVEAIWLTIPSSGERCVYEVIQANVVVVGDYLCIDQDNVGFGPTIDIQVNLTRRNYTRKQTRRMSHYTVNGTALVSLDWKVGIRTKDWDAVAKKEKIEQGVELELRKSAERVNEISANIIYLRIREASMREINDKTNKRVAQFSFISLGLSVIVSLFQVWHLKRFFLKKKLI
ncbi:Transmembrane emp24 domain-containing protein p24delta6 [Raphanus sativus]|nr:Transmembrane emp24 domain-containing protein p24delta6 [Raphanus sativus]